MAFTTYPLQVMGTRVMGDAGGFTIYTDSRYRKVIYKKAPPDKPASRLQRICRDNFKAAVSFWKVLSDSEKAALELAVAKASLCLTGQNLYTSCWLRAKYDLYATISRQTNVTLPPLPPPR